ncbi:hypothetical protein H0S70_02390 [Chryseobacterium manosquense]|uniref:Uncharacterized protein n=1 Tax=Chryseobacterium manosquense TaxID=2754694 RepID=A0A7H1DY00_9FLAO|nr:hypothetical protein [Chryseobacterium manosquense]QNS41858.1 hypothetical protein H0S70_02390 [Chryseobacterium manosquense]
MEKDKEQPAQTKKENQDLPNIPASSDKMNSEKTVKRQIKESSKLNKDGKTDNTKNESRN